MSFSTGGLCKYSMVVYMTPCKPSQCQNGSNGCSGLSAGITLKRWKLSDEAKTGTEDFSSYVSCSVGPADFTESVEACALLLQPRKLWF